VVLTLILYVLYLLGERAAQAVLYTAGIMLTFPSIGLFGLFIPLFGIGFMNAAVALILYAQLPILRNTYTGIKEVPSAIIEAGRGMGMTEFQILYKVKLPMTVPVIMAGVRVSMVMIVGIAAIAKLIGVLCLGKYIFDGIGTASDSMVITGAVGVSIFALLVDGLLGWAQGRLTPTGLREQSA
jgi:osmoprotectant transport system permease protein